MSWTTKLPECIRDMILAMPEHRMGLHKVTLETADGKVFPDVEVAWGDEVLRVAGYDALPFRPEEVVAAYESP